MIEEWQLLPQRANSRVTVRSFYSAFSRDDNNSNPLCQIEHRVEHSRVAGQAERRPPWVERPFRNPVTEEHHRTCRIILSRHPRQPFGIWTLTVDCLGPLEWSVVPLRCCIVQRRDLANATHRSKQASDTPHGYPLVVQSLPCPATEPTQRATGAYRRRVRRFARMRSQ
jgi:hypothetical protein